MAKKRYLQRRGIDYFRNFGNKIPEQLGDLKLIFSIPKVLVVGETRDMAHAAEMVRVLKEKYTNLSFTGHGDALGKVIYPKY